MLHLSDKGHRTARAISAHDGSVQGNDPFSIRQSLESYRKVFHVQLGIPNPSFHRIEDAACLLQFGPGIRIGGDAMIPSRKDKWLRSTGFFRWRGVAF